MAGLPGHQTHLKLQSLPREEVTAATHTVGLQVRGSELGPLEPFDLGVGAESVDDSSS